ncbi:MAG TPA: hypothetical protein VIH89_06875 [Candidatus Sulfotelmatobacter sp.]
MPKQYQQYGNATQTIERRNAARGVYRGAAACGALRVTASSNFSDDASMKRVGH